MLAVDYSPAALPLVVLPLIAINRAGRQAVVSERLALADTLTDLPNRVMFRDRAEVALSAAKRRGESVSIMLMDLDRFKEINDTLGHHTGDEVLLEVARRLRRGLRERDTVARLGGDEFAIVVDARQRAGAERSARSSGRASPSRSRSRAWGSTIDASVGVASFPERRPRLRDADAARRRRDVPGEGQREPRRRATRAKATTPASRG